MSGDRHFLPLPVPARDVAVATQVRGSVILPAVGYLRAANGASDRYFAALAADQHAGIKALVPAAWVPIELLVAHCAACDRMALPPATLEAIGVETASFLNAAFISAALGGARALGGTPWMFLEAVDRMRERSWKGGAIAIQKLGPKEALIDWYGQPCGRSNYFRTTFAAFTNFFLAPLSRTLIVRVLDKPTEHSNITLRVSWV